jgi:hypothetical protein
MAAVLGGKAPHAYVATKLLAEACSDLSAVDAAGLTAAHHAAASANADAGRCVRLLLSRGAAAEARTRDGGATPLMLAAGAGNAAAVRALLDAGADVAAVDARGLTAEHFCDPRRMAEWERDLYDAARHGAAAAMLAESRRRMEVAMGGGIGTVLSAPRTGDVPATVITVAGPGAAYAVPSSAGRG